MKQWWQNLAKREQNLVLAMSAFIGVFIFYTALWQPLNKNLEQRQNDVVKKQELLGWVKENTAKFKGTKIQSSSNQRNESLTSIVNNSSREWNIVVARMQPKGDALQVWIDDVSFNDFLSWTENLYLKQGVVINAVDIAEANDAGNVRVNRLELGKG